MELFNDQKYDKLSKHHSEMGVPWRDPTFPGIINKLIFILSCLKRDTGLSFQAGYIGVYIPNERPVSVFKHQKVDSFLNP